jgi:hypothetical protein
MIFKTQIGMKKSTNPVISTNAVTPTVGAIQKSSSSQTLDVSEPETGTIITDKTVKITGKAPKDSLIIAQSPANTITTRNDKEDFSIDFPLAFGENVIRLTVYPKDPTIALAEKEIKIYQLDEQ